MMFIAVSLLSHVISWVRCGTSFVSIPNLCRPSYFFLVCAAENKPCSWLVIHNEESLSNCFCKI